MRSINGTVRRDVPAIVYVVGIATLVSCIGGTTPIGYQVAGFGWLIPAVFSIYLLFTSRGSSAFPYWIWVPWAAWVLLYLFIGDAENALQRTGILLTPIAVGIAVGKSHIMPEGLERIQKGLVQFAAALVVIFLIKSGVGLTGLLPEVTGLAPEVTTAALLASYFACKHALGEKKALVKWGILAALPVIAMTRMGMIAGALTLPLTFGPMPLWKRIAFLAVVGMLGVAVFHTERVQEKMFYSGEGTILDMRRDNPDFNTTGRGLIQEAMEWRLEESPWFGFGANASERFVSELTEGLKHPHNDWLRIEFDYGRVGLLIFVFCLGLQVIHALRSARKSGGAAKLFLLVGAGAFVPYCQFMFTDNIILYAPFFGNLHFLMLGLGYAAARSEEGATRHVGVSR